MLRRGLRLWVGLRQDTLKRLVTPGSVGVGLAQSGLGSLVEDPRSLHVDTLVF